MLRIDSASRLSVSSRLSSRGSSMALGDEVLPLSRREFWVELRARVNCRTVFEEEEAIKSAKANGRNVIEKVKNFGERMALPRVEGCSLESLKQAVMVEANPHKGGYSRRAKALGNLELTDGGLLGFVPKESAAKLLNLGKKAAKNGKVDALLSFLSFLEACRHVVPACRWNKVQAIWEESHGDLGAAVAAVEALSLDSDVADLLKEVDDVEEAFALVHATDASLGMVNGEVFVVSRARQGAGRMLSTAQEWEEYRLLEQSKEAAAEQGFRARPGPPSGVDPTFAINYQTLIVWLRHSKALRTTAATMTRDLKVAKEKWRATPDLDGLLRRVLIGDYTQSILSMAKKPLEAVRGLADEVVWGGGGGGRGGVMRVGEAARAMGLPPLHR